MKAGVKNTKHMGSIFVKLLVFFKFLTINVLFFMSIDISELSSVHRKCFFSSISTFSSNKEVANLVSFYNLPFSDWSYPGKSDSLIIYFNETLCKIFNSFCSFLRFQNI